MLSLISRIASASSSEEPDIFAINSFTFSLLFSTIESASAVSPVIRAPFSTASMVSSISTPVLCAAFADFWASSPTSSATTAKPFPAEPALAASIAAFRERILVWKAMSSIVLIILLISLDLCVISVIAPCISCIFSLLRNTASRVSPCRLLACSAISAFSSTPFEISPIRTERVSTAWDCSVAPCESVLALSASCVTPFLTSVEQLFTPSIVSDKESWIFAILLAKGA